MNCPRCEVALEKRMLVEPEIEIEIDTCPNCSGIWFDKGELPQVDHISEPVFWEWRKLPSSKKQHIPLPCPHCGPEHLMGKGAHERDHKVIIDLCAQCEGVWLDGGELEAIQKENWFSSLRSLLRKM